MTSDRTSVIQIDLQATNLDSILTSWTQLNTQLGQTPALGQAAAQSIATLGTYASGAQATATAQTQLNASVSEGQARLSDFTPAVAKASAAQNQHHAEVSSGTLRFGEFGKVVTEVGGQAIPGLSTSVSNATGLMRSLSEETDGIAAKMSLAGAGIAGLGVAIAGISFEQFDVGLEGLVRLSDQTGMTIPQVQGLESAMQSAGVSADSAGQMLARLSMNLETMQQQVDKGQAPTGRLATALFDLGVNAYDSQGRMLGLSALMPQIADAFKAQSDAAAATGQSVNLAGLANSLFGRTGAQMLPFLLQGSAGLAEYTAKAQAAGIGTADQVAHLDDFKKSSADAALQAKAFGISLGSDMAPAFTAVTSAAGDLFQEMNKLPAPVRDLSVELPLVTGAGLALAASTVKIVESFAPAVDTIVSTARAWTTASASAATLTTSQETLSAVEATSGGASLTAAAGATDLAVAEDVSAGSTATATAALVDYVPAAAAAATAGEAAAFSLAAAAGPIGLLIGGLTVVGGVLLTVTGALKNHTSAQDEDNAAVQRSLGDVNAQTQAWKDAGISGDALLQKILDQMNVTTMSTSTWQQWSDAYVKAAGSQTAAAKATQDATSDAKKYADQLGLTGQQLAAQSDAHDKLNSMVQKASQSTQAEAVFQTELSQSISTASVGTDQFNTSQQKLLALIGESSGSLKQYYQDQYDLNTIEDTLGSTTVTTTIAIQDINDAFSKVSTEGSAQALALFRAELDKGAISMQTYLDDVAKLAGMGPSQEELNLKAAIDANQQSLDAWNAKLSDSSHMDQYIASLQATLDKQLVTGASTKDVTKTETDLQLQIDELTRTRGTAGKAEADAIISGQKVADKTNDQVKAQKDNLTVLQDARQRTIDLDAANKNSAVSIGDVGTGIATITTNAPRMDSAIDISTGKVSLFAGGLATAASNLAILGGQMQALQSGSPIGAIQAGTASSFPTIPGVPAGGSGGSTVAFGLPVPVGTPVTQGYGPTDETAEPSENGYAHFHQGIDYGVAMGTPISAAAAGTVSYAGLDPRTAAAGGPNALVGLGNEVIVNVGNGLQTIYGHLSEIDTTLGAIVTEGQQLGLSGSTGASTGPHLHFQTNLNKQDVDPTQYLNGAATVATASGAASAVPPLSGGTLTAAQIVAGLAAAGMPTDQLAAATAVVLAESGGSTTAGSAAGAFGFAQMMPGFGGISNAARTGQDAASLQTQFQVMVQQWLNGQGPTAWDPYSYTGGGNPNVNYGEVYVGKGQGSYQQFLGQAQAAVGQYTSGGGGGSGDGSEPVARPDTTASSLPPTAAAANEDAASVQARFATLTDTYNTLEGTMGALAAVPVPDALQGQAAAFTGLMTSATGVEAAYTALKSIEGQYISDSQDGLHTVAQLAQEHLTLTAAEHTYTTATTEASHASRDLTTDQKAYGEQVSATAGLQTQLSTVTSGKLASDKSDVTASMLAGDKQIAGSAQATAETAINTALAWHNQVIADLQNNVTPQQLAADQAMAASAQTSSQEWYSYWSTAQGKVTSDQTALVSEINDLGSAITIAIKARDDQQLADQKTSIAAQKQAFDDGNDQQLQSAKDQQAKLFQTQQDGLNAQLQAQKDALSAEQQAQKDALTAQQQQQTDAIDAATKAQVAGIQAQIDAPAIAANAKAEADLRTKVGTESGQQRVTDQASLDAMLLADHNKVLQAQIQSIQAAATKEKQAQSDAYKQQQQTLADAQKLQTQSLTDAQKVQTQALADGQKTQEQTLADHYKQLKQQGDTYYAGYLASVESTYRAATSAATLNAEAMLTIQRGSQQDIVNLLKSFDPDWNTAGKSLGDQLVRGLKASDIPGAVSSIFADIGTGATTATAGLPQELTGATATGQLPRDPGPNATPAQIAAYNAALFTATGGKNGIQNDTAAEVSQWQASHGGGASVNGTRPAGAVLSQGGGYTNWNGVAGSPLAAPSVAGGSASGAGNPDQLLASINTMLTKLSSGINLSMALNLDGRPVYNMVSQHVALDQQQAVPLSGGLGGGL